MDPAAGAAPQPRVLWVRSPDVLWRRTLEAVVLLAPDTGEIITLTATGQALWEALEEPGTVPEVAARVADGYDVAPEVVAADIAPVLHDLERRHVVRHTAA